MENAIRFASLLVGAPELNRLVQGAGDQLVGFGSIPINAIDLCGMAFY